MSKKATTESYELAEVLSRMPSHLSIAERALRVGRSRSYASRVLKAWQGAQPILRWAWREGHIAFEAVKMLAEEQGEIQTHEVIAYLNHKGIPLEN